MKIVEDLTDKELSQTILAEVAKARNELNSAERDLQKARSRLGFLIVLANEMINRGED
jgi:hypothetical protein